MKPLLRFACIGTVLFLVVGGARSGGGSVVHDARPGREATTDQELLLREAIARGYHESDPIVRRRLARNMRFAGADPALDDDVLVRDALALGMHETDLVVRRRLVQKMELLAAARARADEPSAAELRAFLERHVARFTEPARVRAEQVFFRDEARARAALHRAQATDPARVDSSGDPLALPRELPSLSEAELARRLGPAFAAAVFALEPGEWHGPIASAFGAHLVRVRARTAARPSPLESVRGEVREALLAERAAAELTAEISRLRERSSG